MEIGLSGSLLQNYLEYTKGWSDVQMKRGSKWRSVHISERLHSPEQGDGCTDPGSHDILRPTHFIPEFGRL